jgi:hypothetical protein
MAPVYSRIKEWTLVLAMHHGQFDVYGHLCIPVVKLNCMSLYVRGFKSTVSVGAILRLEQTQGQPCSNP